MWLLAWRASLTWMGASKGERGKYLVEGVAGCGDCHRPMDEKGAPITGKKLQGAPIFFKPIQTDGADARMSGKVAEHRRPTGMGNTHAVKFLMTGIAYNGLAARPPMSQ